ncbi:MAG: hypothetical protein SOR61_03880 [Evtepia sp.]|uniref:hypothetical protein n=1 Tax=Evtepia sp. TaxID=2773933 RepID=UPI002A75AF22|nr:hypothetical protein [Evtepia sp.]MDY3014324.1 hypothetical protein [Evtepia sp.]
MARLFRLVLSLCPVLLGLGLWPLFLQGFPLLDLLPGFVPLLLQGGKWAEK